MGITHQDNKASKKVMQGDKININKLALNGNTVSFANNFKPSAKGCKSPNIPTTLGPFRHCIEAITFLSNSVMYATETNKGINIPKNFNVVFKKNKNMNIVYKNKIIT